MKISIIGFPGSGKSTVFKAITDLNKDDKRQEDPSKPAIGVVKVRDERLYRLAEIFQPKKIVPEELTFTDLPGFNLTAAKDTETLIQVIGVFSGRDYKKDINDMEAEFFVSDMTILEKKLAMLEKELMSKALPQKELEKKVLLRCKEKLDRNENIRELDFSEEEAKALSAYQFLSQKPIFIIANMDETQISGPLTKEILDFCREKKLLSVSICGSVEAEIKELEEKDRMAFAKEMGITELAKDKAIKAARETAGIINFFTGEFKSSETRAWPIPKGINACEAAGKIHTDIKKGFIRAEVVGYDDFINCGSFVEAKNKGLYRLEGKEYIVKDGDIMNFRHNA